MNSLVGAVSCGSVHGTRYTLLFLVFLAVWLESSSQLTVSRNENSQTNGVMLPHKTQTLRLPIQCLFLTFSFCLLQIETIFILDFFLIWLTKNQFDLFLLAVGIHGIIDGPRRNLCSHSPSSCVCVLHVTALVALSMGP